MARVYNSWGFAVLSFILVSYLSPCHSVTTMNPLPTSFLCAFEISIMDPLCGLQQNTADNFDWMRKTSDDPQFTDPEPLLDHTTHLTHGHYLYAPTGTLSTGAAGRLDMPAFARNSEPQCLEFFYQISGDDAGDFNMYQWETSAGQPQTATWMSNENSGDVWIRVLYTIAPQDDYMVMFEAIAGMGIKTYMALDDVSITDGECPYSLYNCTFEADYCGLVQDTTDGDDWYRITGSTSSIYTGPSIDHTLGTDQGFYVYIEASYMTVGEPARLISPSMQGVFDGSPPACLEFFYHMYGPTIGELNIYIQGLNDIDKGDAVWSLTGNRGDKWRGAEVDITLDQDFMLIFEAVRGVSYDGDIALDDILVTRGEQCPGQHKPPAGDQQGTCDFEEVELCAYTQDQTDDADWLWQNRANQYTNDGPLGDHTTGTEFGFYLFLYGDVGHRKTARMISPIVPEQSTHTCLEFWFHLYGNDEQTLNVYCVPDGESIPDTPMLNKSGNYGDYWLRSRHEIPPALTPCNLVFEGKPGIPNRDDLAIDDVSVYQSQQCPQNPYFVNPTTTPPTTSNIACDFESESNPTCGWTQGIRDGFDWTRYSGPSMDYNSGPDVDHTKGTADGWYMLIDSYSNIPASTRAELISPLVAFSGSDRCFRFWYFMDGYYTNFLNAYIIPYGSTMPMDPQVQIYGYKGSQWLEGQLSVPSSDRSFYIYVEGSVNDNPYSADMAVDDFTFQTGACTGSTPPSPPTVANCNFEEDMCGYRQGLDGIDNQYEDNFDWFWNSGSTGTAGSGPTADHTLGTSMGHYMYMEASQPRKPGDRARLFSPVINVFNDSYCLEFYYHMSGLDTASLVVYESGEYYPDGELARLTGPVTTGWSPYNVDVPKKYGAIQIAFEGTVGNNYRSDIGLDDISLTPGPCGGYPMQAMCNFEYGYGQCNFEQSMDDDLDWVWFDALGLETAPIAWPGFGSYMYVSGVNKTLSSTAIFRSPMLTLQQNDHCLSLNYALVDGMQLDVVSESLDGIRKTLMSFKKSTGLTTSSYTLTGVDHPNEYRILIIATVGSALKGLAAIDNVYVYWGYCGEFTNGGQPIGQVSSGTTVGIVLGILLGVAVLVLVAMGVLYCRKKSTGDYPTPMSYNNGGSTDPKPNLSKDPGIDNPNYTSATFATA